MCLHRRMTHSKISHICLECIVPIKSGKNVLKGCSEWGGLLALSLSNFGRVRLVNVHLSGAGANPSPLNL